MSPATSLSINNVVVTVNDSQISHCEHFALKLLSTEAPVKTVQCVAVQYLLSIP